MTRQVKAGERQMKAFEESLARIFGPDNFPREAIGDLSDLLDTLRRGVNLLVGLMTPGKNFERQAATKLLELELLIGDDLRMIAKDLLPSLRRMSKAAYSMRDEGSDSNRRAKRLLKKVNSLRFERDDQSKTK
jgi:hypothetical protein